VPAIERDQPVAGFSPADGFLFPVETHDGCCLDTGDPVCSDFVVVLPFFVFFLALSAKKNEEQMGYSDCHRITSPKAPPSRMSCLKQITPLTPISF
jgi:hypothetical protein